MQRTCSILALSACLGLFQVPAATGAEFIGLNLRPGLLAPTYNNYSSGSGIDLVDDLDTEPPDQTSMLLILEHPIVALPNLRYQGLALETQGGPQPGSRNGLSSGPGDDSTTNYALSQDDFVLYYQLPSNQLDVNLGVDLKRFAGEISSTSPSSTTRVDIDETIPLFYLSARYDLSNSGFYVGANINANFVDLGLSKSTAQDSTIMLGYASGSGLGVEGGYKSFSLNLDNTDNLDSNLEYDGLYLNGYFNF